jgi:hypothetical protein
MDSLQDLPVQGYLDSGTRMMRMILSVRSDRSLPQMFVKERRKYNR